MELQQILSSFPASSIALTEHPLCRKQRGHKTYMGTCHLSVLLVSLLFCFCDEHLAFPNHAHRLLKSGQELETGAWWQELWRNTACCLAPLAYAQLAFLYTSVTIYLGTVLPIVGWVFLHHLGAKTRPPQVSLMEDSI